MPTFTLELFRVEEMNKGDIGLDQYPIFDEEYRAGLNKKIRDHYYNREIGLETIDMFTFAMRRRMNEIMPFYNQLYKSERMAIDPFMTVDLTTIAENDTIADTTVNASSDANTETDNGSRSVQSTTPQVMLSGSGDYASSAADTTSKGVSKGITVENSDSTNTENQNTESHTTGFQGNQSEMLNAFRQTFMNIDMLVIEDLADLFMGVWGTSDDYLPIYLEPLPELNY